MSSVTGISPLEAMQRESDQMVLEASRPVAVTRPEAISGDPEMRGLAQGIGAVVGGATAMAHVYYLASFFLATYICSPAWPAVAIGIFAVVVLGAIAGAKMATWAQKCDRNRG